MWVAGGMELIRERWRMLHDPASVEECARAAIDWLYAAQDSTPDRGVSQCYILGHGWMQSYPETTGYIIPTLLNWSRATGDTAARRRAVEMADWEIEVQLESGAVPDLRDGSGVVFDTGQVIFGWLAAHRETGEERYLQAARRGSDWLLRQIGEEGIWLSSNDAGGPGRVYNARVAWALAELARLTGDTRLEASVRRSLDWTLKQERGYGWFGRNCLTDDSAPLLHTIVYAARGQLESGLILGEWRYVESAARTASKLVAALSPDGYLPGRFDQNWRPTTRWACLTGMAQASILWRRLAVVADGANGELPLPPSRELVRCAQRVNSFLRRTQDRSSHNPGLRGGIRGSFPVNGDYCKWAVLNWATKFFVDALMFDLPVDVVRYPG